jgi:hypothetical protein
MDNAQKHNVCISALSLWESSFYSDKVPNTYIPSGVEVKNTWSFTYMLPLHIHGLVSKYRDQSYVIVAMSRKCV